MLNSKIFAFIFRRLLQMIPVVLAIAALNFGLVHLAPGDAADILGGLAGHATPEFVAQLRAEFGLDLPLYKQFFIYMGKILTLDLGYSYLQQTPVLDLILGRLPATVLLMASSLVLAICFGVLLGSVSAMRRGSWVDNVISVMALIIYAAPVFWLGLMLIVFFAVTLGILPSGGMATIGNDATGFSYVLDVLEHLVLPAGTLALFYMALYTRVMRASMLEVYTFDFIRTARAKGLSEHSVAWSHAARNALLPVVTLAGVQLGHLLGGSILIETVFAWPGLGRLIIDALFQRDLNLLLGILLVSSFIVIIASLITDLIYGFLDPRTVYK